MKKFEPKIEVENCEIILDDGEWPSFHDAEVHNLNISRGDMRPDDNVWIGTVIEASFELCALKNPYIAVLKFHDCDEIRMQQINYQNAVYDLHFEYIDRGSRPSGEPLPPSINVRFVQAFCVELSFKCFKIQVLERREI